MFWNVLSFLKSDDDEWWIVFVAWLNGERHLALFPTGIFVRDPHHCESPTCCKQDFNLCRTWFQALLKVITTTPQHHYTTSVGIVFCSRFSVIDNTSQAVYPSTFVYSCFSQRCSFFTVCLVQWLCGVAPYGFLNSGKEWGGGGGGIPPSGGGNQKFWGGIFF